MQRAGQDLGLGLVGRVRAPLRDELLEVLGGDVDLGAAARADAAERGDLERGDGHVADGGARLEAAGDRDHRHAVGAGQLGELAAGRHDDAAGAEHAGGLVAGERLLGVARVARAQHRRVGRRPGRQPVGRAARRSGARRGRRATARASAPPIAEPPMPATTRPPGLSQRLEAGGLDLPQRVAQVLGQREDVVDAGRTRRRAATRARAWCGCRCWTALLVLRT